MPIFIPILANIARIGAQRAAVAAAPVVAKGASIAGKAVAKGAKKAWDWAKNKLSKKKKDRDCPTGKCKKRKPKDSRVRKDLDDKYVNEDGSLKWPKNNGAAGPEKRVTLDKGKVIDRYGDPRGRFTSPDKTPFSERSLPYDRTKVPYNRYEVARPFETNSSRAASWFGEKGGGTQFRMDKSIADLVKDGYLRKLP